MAALGLAGLQVATFTDPLAAWDALEAAQQMEVLFTLVQYAPGKSSGVSLARMARAKRPAIRVLFVALPEHAAQMEGLGASMPMSVSISEIVASIERLLRSLDPPL